MAKNSDDNTSTPNNGRAGEARLKDSLPAIERFDWLDRITIAILIIIFTGLVIWFVIRGDQPLYQYWMFMTLLTLIFVGVLRATGIIRLQWVALGGSVAVFGGLIWLTGPTFERFYDSNQKIVSLTQKIEREQSANEGLQSQINKIKNDLDNVQNQDLAIATYDARYSKPIKLLKFMYVLNDGSEKVAVKNENLHIIPKKDLRNVIGISLEFDLADARPDRPAAIDVTKPISIERMNLHPSPLKILLFVHLGDRN